MEEVLNNIDTFVDFFYKDFFEDTPEIEVIFRNTELKLQKEQLKLGLEKIFSLSEDREELDRYLNDLGVRHVAYEVTPVQYEFAKRSLMKAFRHTLKNSWNEELETRVGSLIEHICTVMHEGALKVSKAA
jgi:hemoglobin-like flavoprotein